MPANPEVNIEALLAHVPLFNGLATDEIARIARGTREVNSLRGDILFHKGDPSNGFYLIVYGQVKLAFAGWRKSRGYPQPGPFLWRGGDVYG